MKTLTASRILFKPAALAALLTLAAVATAPLPAQQTAAPVKAAHSAPATAVDEEESVAPAKPGSEGIKVHGHWILDVKDKDGKLVEHRDFQNALYTTTGVSAIISLLGGQHVPNSFTILLYDSQSNPYRIYPPTTSTLLPVGARVCSSAAGTPACNPNLITTLHLDSRGYYDSIILAGTFAPSTAISLTTVRTNANACFNFDNTPVSLTPAQCAAFNSYSSTAIGVGDYDFTGTVLTTPLSVAAGQTVSVTVILSFS
jgi:hypothetical protein